MHVRTSLSLLALVWLTALVLFSMDAAAAASATASASETAETLLKVPEDDLYSLLGLGEQRDDAAERDIKNAFRRLSKMFHPDVAGTTDTYKSLYQRIQRAYEILGDRRKRKVFDILGLEGVTKLEQQQQQPQQQQAMHPFFHLFGGGQASPDRGADREMLMVVSLEDIDAGAAHTFHFSKRKICRTCKGTGARSAEDIVQCPQCRGSGREIRRVQLAPGFIQQMEQRCSHCNGHGSHVARKCPVCSGKQVVQGESMLSVDVEAGLPEGEVLTYELEADQTPGQVPGDLKLIVVTAPHPVFTRKGNDLHTTQQLSLKEALLGFSRVLPHLNGREVELERSGVTQHSYTQKLTGEGLPRHHVPSERGDLYVVYHVQLPDSLSPEQQALFEAHFG